MKTLLFAAACAVVMAGRANDAALIDEALPPADGWSPLGFAVMPAGYMQFPGAASDVDGLRLGLTMAHNRQVSGIDIGAIGSWADGEINGLSCSGIYRQCGGAAFGIHLSSTLNYASARLNGCQVSLVNSAYLVNGLQLGLVNYVSEENGLQVGAFNLAETMRGVQVGLVNTTMNCSGIQIGLGNIIGESPLTACVFMNVWF